MDNQLAKHTAVFWLVVQKLQREPAHARTLDGDFELTIMRMLGFSSQFLDNQPENRCKLLVLSRGGGGGGGGGE